jgi:hypothetical protein
VSHFVGLDLGQSAEHTALAVVEDVPQQTPCGSTQHHLYVRRLERYPLRTSYPDIALAVAVMMRSHIPHPPPAWSFISKGTIG